LVGLSNPKSVLLTDPVAMSICVIDPSPLLATHICGSGTGEIDQGEFPTTTVDVIDSLEGSTIATSPATFSATYTIPFGS
jgi:hypothetical protein